MIAHLRAGQVQEMAEIIREPWAQVFNGPDTCRFASKRRWGSLLWCFVPELHDLGPMISLGGSQPPGSLAF